MGKYGWLLDPKRCIECRACEAACKQWNQVETGINVRYRLVRIKESGNFPQVKVQALSVSCNHCENALCIKACPLKAISRRPDGIILIDKEKCWGCGMCALFCPYDGPQMNMRIRKMEKCTMCADRIDQGLQPACASVCPTGALQWGNWDDIKQQGVARVDGFSNPALTRPQIRFIDTGWGAR